MQYNTLLTVSVCACTAQTQVRKFETNIPRKGMAQPQSQFPHSCVCERFIYSHNRSANSAAGKYVNGSWEYINGSQNGLTDTWMWKLGLRPRNSQKKKT
jgi:hypothetical protein